MMSRFTDDLAGATERRVCPWDGVERTRAEARRCADAMHDHVQAVYTNRVSVALVRCGDAKAAATKRLSRQGFICACSAWVDAYEAYRDVSDAIESDTPFGEWVRLAERYRIAYGKSGPAFGSPRHPNVRNSPPRTVHDLPACLMCGAAGEGLRVEHVDDGGLGYGGMHGGYYVACECPRTCIPPCHDTEEDALRDWALVHSDSVVPCPACEGECPHPDLAPVEPTCRVCGGEGTFIDEDDATQWMLRCYGPDPAGREDEVERARREVG